MDYTVAREKLLNHANLTHGLALATDEESLLFVLWNAHNTKIAPDNLSFMTKDIIECLDVVNKNWNGEVPSETLDSSKEIERYLVLAVNQIIHTCWQNFLEWQKMQLFEPIVLQQLSLTAWTISCAWNALLAGDIDNIEQEVGFEKMAQSFLTND